MSLRLEGATFREVLSLGGGASGSQDPGAALGAAFSSPDRGLARRERAAGAPDLLPGSQPPAAVARDRSAATCRRSPPRPGSPWPRSGAKLWRLGASGCSDPLQARSGMGPGKPVRARREHQAPQPARGRLAHNRIAPTPWATKAPGGGQMWLWRGETGLWEPDPATPINFRGNLLGVAFDPSNPARGYAVGTTVLGRGGMIMRYGKSWTEEASLPAEAQGAAVPGHRVRRLRSARAVRQAAERRKRASTPAGCSPTAAPAGTWTTKRPN